MTNVQIPDPTEPPAKTVTTGITTNALGTVTGASLETTDWKAEARKWEDRAKANITAAVELEQIKQSQMSEAEKASERLAAAERKAADAEAKAVRRDVALEHQLKAEDAALLDAVTDEKAMRALAQRLATDAATRRNVVPTEGRPNVTPQDDGMRAFTRRLFSQPD